MLPAMSTTTRMSAPTRESTVTLSRCELAEVLGVAPNTLSGAAHGKHLCQGYPVSEWAVLHPRGNHILRYKVPSRVVEEEAPDGQKTSGKSPP